MSDKKQPVKKFKYGGVEAAVWENEKDGNVSHNVSIERSYTTDEGKTWEKTTTFNNNDLPKAIFALTEAYKFL